MGSIIMPEGMLDKVKALPFYKVPHYDQSDMIKLGYPPASIDQNEQYGSKDADNNGIEWEWTKFFIPNNWTDVGLMFDKANPGYVIPQHKDHFKFYVDHFDHKKEDVRRRIVFLEDWKWGHYFQLKDEPFVKWKQGDWVEWGCDDYHLGGNFGKDIRYTLQVTGVPHD